MEYWIFMLIMDILIPFTMIGFGYLFRKKVPKSINPAFGYRTSMSMKNSDTWEFAHKYCGRIWYRWGIISLLFSAAALCVVFGKDEDTIGNFGAVICYIQIFLLIGSIYPTERALRKTFNKNGDRK